MNFGLQSDNNNLPDTPHGKVASLLPMARYGIMVAVFISLVDVNMQRSLHHCLGHQA